MVDTLIAAAALATAANAAQALGAPSDEQPTSLKTGEERSAVQKDRRLVARSAPRAGSDLESLRPLIQRAKLDSSLNDTKVLLDKAENQIKIGNREQAMLTLDGANMQLERVRTDMKGNTNFIDTFIELETRESLLREKIGGDMPQIVPLRPIQKDGETAPATSDEKRQEAPVKPPKRDELPVG